MPFRVLFCLSYFEGPCKANPTFQPTLEGGDGDDVQFCSYFLLHFQKHFCHEGMPQSTSGLTTC
jgi:hypothetical protein